MRSLVDVLTTLLCFAITSSTIPDVADAYHVRLPFAAVPSLSRRTRQTATSSALCSGKTRITPPLHQSAVTASEDQFVPPSSSVSWDWQAVAESVFEKDDRPIILFDGHCNLCNGGVNFALDHDPNGRFRFVSLQSKVGQSLLIRSGRDPNDISSIVLCLSDGQTFCESDAILKICQHLEGLPMAPLLPAVAEHVVPRPVRNFVYHVVSNNRYRFGEAQQYEQCRLDLDGEYDNRFVEDP